MTARARVSATLIACALTSSSAIAAPVLRSADIGITVTSPVSCEVTMTLAVEGGSEIDHRVEAFPPSPASSFGGHPGVELIGVRGAQQVGELRTIGRTQSLVLRVAAMSYALQYRAELPRGRAYRCPMWLPTVPTDGLSRVVRLQVELPSSAVPGSSMPAFTWNGANGSTTLRHMPAFVRVPFGHTGDARGPTRRSFGEGGRDVARLMDAAAVAVLAGASALWIWRRRR